MPLPESIRTKLERFTVRPAGAPSAGAGGTEPPETIVVAQLRDEFDAAFALARTLVEAGERVRMIGPGMTFAHVWPAWARAARGLTFTEWGAFHHEPRIVATRVLHDEIKAWLRETCGELFAPLPPDDVLFGSACLRFLQSWIEAHQVTQALASVFPGSTVYCPGGGGRPATALLAQFVRAAGGRFVAPRERSERARGRLWPALIAALGAGALAGALVQQVRAFVDAAPSRRALRDLRAARASEPATTWVGLTPDWDRMNHHLVDAFASPELAHGAPLGVLLVTTLAPGRRSETTHGEHASAPLWPALGPIHDHLAQCTVEQVVMPEEPAAFALEMTRAAARSARLLARLARRPRMHLPSASVDLTRDAWSVARWATVDVVRGTMAQAAARSLVARRPVAGHTFLIVSSNIAELAAPDLTLQRAGATTVEHPHGCGYDNWSGDQASASSARCVWTRADARSAATPRQRTITTGMPLRMDLPARDRPVKRLLIASNYVHRDSIRIGSALPIRHFQREMLDLVPHLRALGHGDLEVRWRPHPADLAQAVDEDAATVADLAVSRGVTLEEDITWCDLLVTSYSTVVVESLFAGVPVFVQAPAELWGLPATDYLSADRLFFYARDGASMIDRQLRGHPDGRASALAPERAAREALFGDRGVPTPMHEFFGSRRTQGGAPEVPQT